MITTLGAAATGALAGSYRYAVRVESWLGGTLLDDDVPVHGGGEETDRTLRVPERVTLRVPRVANGVNYSPVADDHPLAANGQRLRVQLGVAAARGDYDWLQRGWFLVQESRALGDTVTVTAVGLLALIDEARLVSPYQPSGTLVSTLRGLVEPALTVDVDALLVDRAVPAAINFDDDRLTGLNEVIDAWPADAYVTPDGYLAVVPDTQSLTPVLALTDGTGGTVVTAAGNSTRDGAYNAVVARGTASDGGQVQGVAYDLSGGPKAYGSQFNPLPVPYFYASPLLTTVAQCNKAAASVLARLQRQTAQAFDVDSVPDPRVQVGDVVTITTADYTDLLCSVEVVKLPYRPDGGTMTLALRRLT